jgi:hypothetical protein
MGSVNFSSSTKTKTEQLKTPVSLLNEVCSKAHMTPQFITTESGPAHDRIFECIVKLERQGMTWEGNHHHT